MEPIRIGLLLPGAEIFNDLNKNPTWKGFVKTHDDTVLAFVKELSLRSLYVECICAIVGRYLGLPIPKPLIVYIDNKVLSYLKDDEYILAYGSEDAGYPSFRRHAQSEEAYEKLKLFSKSLDVAVFDEWIGNWDRNQGNILYDGGNEFSFIDHENSIGVNLNECDAAESNQLISVLYFIESEFEKYKIRSSIRVEMYPEYQKIPFGLLSEATHASLYMQESDILHVVRFLENRMKFLDGLLSARLGMKQQEMTI